MGGGHVCWSWTLVDLDCEKGRRCTRGGDRSQSAGNRTSPRKRSRKQGRVEGLRSPWRCTKHRPRGAGTNCESGDNESSIRIEGFHWRRVCRAAALWRIHPLLHFRGRELGGRLST